MSFGHDGNSAKLCKLDYTYTYNHSSGSNRWFMYLRPMVGRRNINV